MWVPFLFQPVFSHYIKMRQQEAETLEIMGTKSLIFPKEEKKKEWLYKQFKGNYIDIGI